MFIKSCGKLKSAAAGSPLRTLRMWIFWGVSRGFPKWNPAARHELWRRNTILHRLTGSYAEIRAKTACFMRFRS